MTKEISFKDELLLQNEIVDRDDELYETINDIDKVVVLGNKIKIKNMKEEVNSYKRELKEYRDQVKDDQLLIDVYNLLMNYVQTNNLVLLDWCRYGDYYKFIESGKRRRATRE